MRKINVKLSDFTESAALADGLRNSADTCNGGSCRSCGGGCYGCKVVESNFYLQKRGLKENSRDLKDEIRSNP